MHGLADLYGVHRVGVVVDVRDLLAAKFHDDVAAFQARFLSRAAAAHAGEFHAGNLGRVIGNGAEVGAQILATATAGISAGNGEVVGTLRAFREVGDEGAGELRDAFEAVVVECVGLVGRAMVILMAAGEEIQHRHAFRVERRGVGGQVGIFLEREVEAGGDVAFLDELAPRAGGTDALQAELVVAQAADHVEVHIRSDVRHRDRRMLGKLR